MVRNLHACFQEPFSRLAAQLIFTVVQKFTNGCPRRTRTRGGTVDDRVAVEEVAFFNDSEPGTHLAFGRMDNPDFWYEVSVIWSFLGADWVVSVFTSDDGHYAGRMAGASAGPLCRGVCGSNNVCDVVPNGSAHRFGSVTKGDRLSRGLDEEFFSLEADGSRVASAWERLSVHGLQHDGSAQFRVSAGLFRHHHLFTSTQNAKVCDNLAVRI